MAIRLQKSIEGAVIPDQYKNVSFSINYLSSRRRLTCAAEQFNNPRVHYEDTGPEIIEAVVSTPSTESDPSSGKVDVLVAGVGTGGTVTGVSRALKAHNQECIVVGVDPVSILLLLFLIFSALSHPFQRGSILAVPESLNDLKRGMSYVVEGTGYDFIPQVLSRSCVDVWIKTDDDESFVGVKQLMRYEGLLVGGSSGSALCGALKWLRETVEGRRIAETEGANVVIIVPDGYVRVTVLGLSSY